MWTTEVYRHLSKKYFATIKSATDCLIEYQNSENKELINKTRCWYKKEINATVRIYSSCATFTKPINMIKLYIIILTILLPSITFSQQLTIDETLEYISEQHSKNNAYKIVNNRLNERKYT